MFTIEPIKNYKELRQQQETLFWSRYDREQGLDAYARWLYSIAQKTPVYSDQWSEAPAATLEQSVSLKWGAVTKINTCVKFHKAQHHTQPRFYVNHFPSWDLL